MILYFRTYAWGQKIACYGMITKKQYVEYLMSTPKNCTCTYLAEHLEESINFWGAFPKAI